MIAARNPGPCEGFDEFAGRRWIYPNNLPIRGYQKTAVELALFNNAMIVLPTGLGKTFIAAVVMYNFYLWYPQGKIIFVAPTRPLVAQQIQECRKISGIPTRDSIELTGMINSEKRRILWHSKRVFFATPQVIENDLTNGLLPAQFVRCIVIDEAHRAQGNYAYVNIVRHLHENNRNGFRVLALSATPGSDIQRVQQVMLNLYINEVMFRSENSLDLIQFKNAKMSKAWTVSLNDKYRAMVDKYITMCDPYFKELYKAGLTFGGNSVDTVSSGLVLRAQKEVYANQVPRAGTTRSRLIFVSSAALSLSHNFELLVLYGLRVFHSSVKGKLENEGRSALKTVKAGKVELDVIMNEIETMFGADLTIDPNKKPTIDLLQGHPKLTVVKNLLMEHFNSNEARPDTRAMIFSKYRDSVYDIVQTLRAYEPLIKPAAFVGQGKGISKGTTECSGMTQREQIELVKRFKGGEFNVLVATCVAEEGLDIGEVDLIICYDTSSSPISTMQRRGRTGRKRSGNVQTILTQGYEEKKLQKAGNARRQVEDQLFKRENYTPHKYRDAPRMVPLNLKPVCLEQRVYPVIDPEDEKPPSARKRRKSRLNESSEDVIDGGGSLKKAKKSKKGEEFVAEEKARAAGANTSKSLFEDDTSNDTDDLFDMNKDFESQDNRGTGDTTTATDQVVPQEDPTSAEAKGGEESSFLSVDVDVDALSDWEEEDEFS